VSRILIILIPLVLAGCVTEQPPVLPMALAPTEVEQASCLDIPDAPAFGDCDGETVLPTAQE
jgi:hypothetical protein